MNFPPKMLKKCLLVRFRGFETIALERAMPLFDRGSYREAGLFFNLGQVGQVVPK